VGRAVDNELAVFALALLGDKTDLERICEARSGALEAEARLELFVRLLLLAAELRLAALLPAGYSEARRLFASAARFKAAL
jgi:hypothetical protein